MNEKEKSSVEQLIPTIKSEFESEEYKEIISNMTYRDYLSAVYSYEESARKKVLFDTKLKPPMKYCEDKRAEAERLREAAEANREQRRLAFEKAVSEQKAKWQETCDILDEGISKEIERITRQTEDEIRKRKREYNSAAEAYNAKSDELKKELKRLDRERENLERKRNTYDNYSMNDSQEVADKEALAILEKAKKKRWLTSYHRELLGMKVNEVCDKRINDFDDLLEREREFARSDMLRAIKKGEVTREVIKEFATRSGIVFGVLLGLFAAAAVVVPTNLFLAVIQAAASCIFAGGLMYYFVKLLGKKFLFGSKLTIEGYTFLTMAFIFGGVVGFFVWNGLIFGSRNLIPLLYTLISAAGSGFIFRQALLTKPFEKPLKRLPFLKNRARYYVFKNSVKEENGKYNLQIYCYLNHKKVLHYLSIKFMGKVASDYESKLELNRNIYKKTQEQLYDLTPQKRDLENRAHKLKVFIKRQKAELNAKIAELEAQKSDIGGVDFEAMIPQEKAAELRRFDEEYDRFQRNIVGIENELKSLEEKIAVVTGKYDKILRQYDLISSALRYWNKTPTPSATDYRLLDSMCFESNKQLSIIHHNLQPFAFRYSVSRRQSSPSKSLKSTIFRYIRALLKINPCRMLQINIIDPVSDPEILLGDDSFTRLSTMGVINGVHSLNDFEIRLFTNERTYNTFRSVFKSQCGEIQRLLVKNKDKIEKGEPYSVELANRIKNDENEPFMYQVMMFIVPRADDNTTFEPPMEIVRTMENGTYFNMGLLPVFFVDNESVHEKWKDIVEMCPEGCVVR